MRRFVIFLMLAVFVILYFSAGGISAQEKTEAEQSSEKAPLSPQEQDKEKPAKEEEPREITKEEILEYLNNMFTYRMDIREAFPEVVPVVNGEGEIEYFEFNGIRLEKLNKDLLMGLMRAVSQKVSQRNLENLQRQQRQQQQMRQLRQMQQLNRQQKQQRQLQQMRKK